MLIFTLFLLTACIVLWINIHSLQVRLNAEDLTSQERNLRNDCKKIERKLLKANLIAAPSDFYIPSSSCMTPNECRMYYYIENILFELFPYKNIDEKKYYIFPQMALYSIVEKRTNLTKSADNTAFYGYIAKSVDFVICRCNLQNYTREDTHQDATFHAYTPVLLIELDGDSHSSDKRYGRDAYQRQQESDEFKNSLFSDLNIPFFRYQLHNNSIYADDSIKIKDEIIKHLIKNSQN